MTIFFFPVSRWRHLIFYSSISYTDLNFPALSSFTAAFLSFFQLSITLPLRCLLTVLPDFSLPKLCYILWLIFFFFSFKKLLCVNIMRNFWGVVMSPFHSILAPFSMHLFKPQVT